jgi:molecular chaperone DnaK
MRLGIDFGTTRIVAAVADRGNYPLVSFESGDGAYDWLPPLVAIHGGERRYGWSAWHSQTDPQWTVIRSLKRFLEDSGPHTQLELGFARVPLMELLAGITAEVRQALVQRYGGNEAFEIMLGVPANANSNQRYLTVEAFRMAGFQVLGLLNEPSAASIEFAHREKVNGRVLVYDLGGGTFDVSLVEMTPSSHRVLATEGISTLGGDDFDHILAEMAVGEAKMGALSPAALFRLEEECRCHKEALHPNTRRILLDLDPVEEGLGQAVIPVASFYQRCAPLIARTVEAAARVAANNSPEEIEVLYVTGGGSGLPLVPRMLREEFGRKVKRSEYTRSATAIGLAIQADAASGYKLWEVFTRNFGVWREEEGGQRVVLDVIFPQGTRLPAPEEPPLTVTRTYRPAHNIGHFRYVEAAQVENSQPSGDLTIWDEIRFPFDPSLAESLALEHVPVQYCAAASGQEIEERYTCDATGRVTVAIHNVTSHYGREYPLSRWSNRDAVVTPSPRKRRRHQGA